MDRGSIEAPLLIASRREAVPFDHQRAVWIEREHGPLRSGTTQAPNPLGGGCGAKFTTDELKSPTRASLVPWSMRRIPVIATLMLLIVTLAACGGGPATTTIPTIGLGVSLHEAEQFFNQQGGGGWIPGEYTGGEIGYAGGNATGRYCPAQLSGQVKELNHIYVACLNTPATKVTPEETAAVIQATVHRFVPGATDWARETMASLSSSSSSATSDTYQDFWPNLFVDFADAAGGGSRDRT